MKNKIVVMKKGFILMALLIVLASVFSGCETYEDFHDPAFEAFRTEIKNDYPSIAEIKMEKAQGSGAIDVFFTMRELSEPEILSIVREFRKVAMQESAQQRLIKGKPVGLAPKFYLQFRRGITFLGMKFDFEEPGVYVFTADYYDQLYNSGNDPSVYTIDGYATWEGSYYPDEDLGIATKNFSAEEIAGEDS